MATRFLSPEEKAKGIKHHYRHQAFNGAGFNFLGDTPVYLLAISFGASNTQLGYISSTLFITGMLLTIVPRLFAGVNIVKLQAGAWLLRGLTCLSYSALFFIDGKPAVYLILGVYTLFCTFRIAGVVVYQPLIKSITNNRNKGTVLSRSALNFHWPLSIGRVVSFLFTSIKQFTGVTGILVLQWLGIIMNTIAAYHARKIPCREKVRYTRGQNVFTTLNVAMKNREARYSLYLSWTNTALMVTFGFVIPFLRRGVQMSSSLIFLYTLGAGIASVTAGLYSQSFADRIGSRPILLGSTLLLGLCTLLWMLTPQDLNVSFYFIFGFLTTFSLFINSVMTNRLVVRTMPENDMVTFSAMVNFFAGIVSFIIGLSSGILADISSSAGLPLPNDYSLTFLLASILVCLNLLFAHKVKDPGSLPPRQAAKLMFSLTNLATYQRINQISKTENPTDKKALLLELGKDKTDMAEREIQKFFHNPLSNEKGEGILALFSTPRPNLIPELLKEAQDPHSYHRIRAIFALGGYPDDETEALLIKLLDDPDPTVRSTTAKSLGRIKSYSELEKVRRQAAAAEGIWNHINYTIALKNMDKEGLILRDVFLPEYSSKGESYVQTHYSLHAQLQNFTPELAGIFQSRNLKQGQGLRDFLDEARDNQGFLDNHSNFINGFSKNEFIKIWNLCRNLIKAKECSSYFNHLKQSILEYPLEKSGYDDALAVVYFAYQLIKIDPEEGYSHPLD